MADICEEDLVASIADALQFISANHPADYIANLAEAWRMERSKPARDAMGQILLNSRMAALGRRPICQDTGTAQVFMRVGLGARILSSRSLQEVVDDAVRRAWLTERNPLRASVVSDPLFTRRNTGVSPRRAQVVPGRIRKLWPVSSQRRSVRCSCLAFFSKPPIPAWARPQSPTHRAPWPEWRDAAR